MIGVNILYVLRIMHYASLRVLPVFSCMVVWCQIDAFLFSLDYLDVCVQRPCDILKNIFRGTHCVAGSIIVLTVVGLVVLSSGARMLEINERS